MDQLADSDAQFKNALCDLSSPENFSLVRGHISERMRLHTAAEWIQIFEQEGVWYAEVQRFEDVLDDAQANVTGAFAVVDGVEQKLVACPIRFSCAEHGPRGGAPLHGEHTEEVLAELQREERRQLSSD
jgi:crotonobetainyl-CoA:carnitine CoA-transferase CaiB-like acyl-CoA transferase